MPTTWDEKLRMRLMLAIIRSFEREIPRAKWASIAEEVAPSITASAAIQKYQGIKRQFALGGDGGSSSQTSTPTRKRAVGSGGGLGGKGMKETFTVEGLEDDEEESERTFKFKSEEVGGEGEVKFLGEGKKDLDVIKSEVIEIESSDDD